MRCTNILSALPALLLLGGLTSCDTTPRERQEIVRQEARNLDSLAERTADKLKGAGQRAAAYDSAARVRSRQPLDNASLSTFTAALLGPHAAVEQLTPATIEPAYTYFLKQVRARRRGWNQRDWDYATAISKRLNDQFAAIRLDVKGRDELHIRALQTEFVTLETSRDVKDLSRAVRH